MNKTYTVEELLEQIKNHPESVDFSSVITTISNHYHYQPVSFFNGKGIDMVTNVAGTNEGSCKIFAFAQMNDLSQDETLACFGDYYRNDVLKNPDGSDHANIRTFIKYGWDGVIFSQSPLSPKN